MVSDNCVLGLQHATARYHVVGSFRCKFELKAVRIYTGKESIWKLRREQNNIPLTESFSLPWYLFEGVGGETNTLEVLMEKRAVGDDAPSVCDATPVKVTNAKLWIEDVEVQGPVNEGKGERSS